MTTTNDKMRARVIALVGKARATTYTAEADTYMEKAKELVEKYELPASLLTDATPQAPSAARRPGYTPPARKYPCRFGCGTMTQHTIDEMNECAERRRNATGSDSAYADAPYRRSSGDFFDQFFGRGFYDASGYQGGGHHERASYQHPGSRRTGSENVYSGAKSEPRARDTGSHANCNHPATKSARAHCRKKRQFREYYGG